jgi:hypothetical protein
MAIEMRFKCLLQDEDYLTVCEDNGDVLIRSNDFDGGSMYVRLDIPTAIKFAKTIRTAINKAKEGGQDNG